MKDYRRTIGDETEEIRAAGGGRFIKTSDEKIFVEMIYADGSSTLIWIDGRIANMEERTP